MRRAVLTKSSFSCGGGAVSYLQQVDCENVVIIADSQLDAESKLVERIEEILRRKATVASVFHVAGVQSSLTDLLVGLAFLKEKQPDTMIVVGDETTIDIAKILLVLYEYPQANLFEQESRDTDVLSLKTKFIVVSTSAGNATEINQIGAIMIDDSFS